MKAAYFYGNEMIKVEEAKKPSPGPNDVIVQVKYCGICGSDRFKWRLGWKFPLDKGTRPVSVGSKLEHILGHESVGTVVELGASVKSSKQGDRVAIYCIDYCGKCYYCKQGMTNFCVDFDKGIMSDHWDGAYADFVRVPAKNLLLLPDDIPFDLGDLLLDTLGCPWEAIRRLEEVGITKNSSIALYGCGPIGMATIKMLSLLGYREIAAVDRSDHKLGIAREMGARHTINNTKQDAVRVLHELYEGLGPDAAMDLAGVEQTQKQAVATSRKGGKVYLMGEAPSMELWVSTCLHNNLTLLFGVYFRISDFPKIVDLLRKGREDFQKIVTHKIPLDDISRGFDIMFKDPDSIRVLIEP